MAFTHYFGEIPVGAKSYRIGFPMRTAAGVGVTGLTGGTLTIYRSKSDPLAANSESPPTLITPTIFEISAANMAGQYDMTPAVIDIDQIGRIMFRITGGTADPLMLFGTVIPRNAVER